MKSYSTCLDSFEKKDKFTLNRKCFVLFNKQYFIFQFSSVTIQKKKKNVILR